MTTRNSTTHHAIAEETVATQAVRDIARITWLGVVINIGLSTSKFAAGFYGGSQVLIADAVHSLSDLATDAAVIIGARYWTQPADDDHPYGHSKIEAFVTFVIGATLGMVGLQLMASAVASLHAMTRPDPLTTAVSPTPLVLTVAIASIFVKELLCRATAVIGRRYRSSAVLANAWHHRSDALSSIPAAVAITASMMLGPAFVFLDAVGTIVVASMIVYTSWHLLEPTFATLLDVGATRDQRLAIETVVHSFPAVRGIHKVRTRPLGGGSIAVDLHTQIDGDERVTEAHALSHAIVHRLTTTLPYVVDVVIHMEPFRPTNNT